MAAKSNPATLGTSNTTIYEAPATFGAFVQLFIANVNATARTYTLSLYKQSTGVTTVLTPPIPIAGSAIPTKGLAFSLEPGDKILGLANFVSSVVVTPVIDLGRSSATKGFTGRGEYDDGATYALNDVVSLATTGASYISLLDDNTGNDPDVSPVYWMLNADQGAQGDAGVAGASSLTVVRVVSTGSESYTSAFENGDTIDGVVLVTNDVVLRMSATAPERNGVYVVPVSGAASRHSDFDTYDEHPGKVFSVMEGTAYADTIWVCTSNRAGTLNTTPIAFVELDGVPVGETPVTSAATTNIGAAATRRVLITGAAGPITSLGTAANKLRFVRFDSAPTLTHHATSLILPAAGNIVTAAGDTAIFASDASGNWRCLEYSRASGIGTLLPGVRAIRRQVFTGSGTYTPDANLLYAVIETIGGGAGGGGAAASAGGIAGGGGGGSGGRSLAVATAAAIGASQAVTIGAAGAGGTAGANAGTAGGTTSVGSLCVANGGAAGNGAAASSPALGGAGGTAGTGSPAATGQPGLNGVGGAATAYAFYNGGGGSSPYGGGGRANNGAGGAGTGYGSGGAGAVSYNAGDFAGGAGTAGMVLITEYCTQ